MRGKSTVDLVNVFRRIESYLQIKNRNIYSMSASEQAEYIMAFPEPKDEIDRSFYQYQCQKALGDSKTGAFLKIAAFVPYWALRIKYVISAGPTMIKQAKAVFLPDGKADDVIPNVLREEFGGWEIEDNKNYYLNKEDIRFIKQVAKKYHKDGMFLLKITTKVARYRYIIDTFRPKALIVCNEYSFTSSVMKLFCEKNNIELINVMHGEKLYVMSDAFFSFNRCYVWDKYYIELFTKLRAEKSQFRIEIPNSMRLIGYENSKKTVDYTYYLTDENEQQVQQIIDIMSKIAKNGNVVAIRSHPRYTDVNKIKTKLPAGILIEAPRDISIQESLARTKNAISFASTVLNQAHANDINIILDDMIRPEEFKKLKEQCYIMINVDHKLLSEIRK